MVKESFRQELNNLASERGYFLHIAHDCVLLIKKQHFNLVPKPCFMFHTLAEVKAFLSKPESA